jgi:hypothetical protein
MTSYHIEIHFPGLTTLARALLKSDTVRNALQYDSSLHVLSQDCGLLSLSIIIVRCVVLRGHHILQIFNEQCSKHIDRMYLVHITCLGRHGLSHKLSFTSL